ncbi:MAG: ribonuclease D, partial [Pseudomonadota bacterium]
MALVDTQKKLDALVETLSASKCLMVDTEFMRERTFYPDLCLIQVANDTDAWAIDPKADGLDLAPFLNLMNDPSILKVFHAARQDLEIF